VRAQGFERERALLVPALAQRLSGAVLEPEILVEPWNGGQRCEARALCRRAMPRCCCTRASPCSTHGRDTPSTSRARPSSATANSMTTCRALVPFHERREIRRQPLGQHGEDLGGGVDRGRVRARMIVDWRLARDEPIDVGDGDPHTRRPV
jgi:hypothetical protein